MHKDQGGDCVELQGIKCYLPKRPPLHEIQGFHLPKREQKWYRTPLPVLRGSDIEVFSGAKYKPNQIVSWEQARREEEIKNTGYDPWSVNNVGRMTKVMGVEPDISYRMPVLSKFRRQELDRVINGHWFMNNGEPTYLTGIGYMYFNWWKLDIGYPNYRKYIREILYVVEVVRGDPVLLGVLLASMRGAGKTYMACCILYTIMIFSRNALGGMQSKTDVDGNSMYSKKLVQPVLALPDFLVPIHNWLTTVPDKEMSFSYRTKAHPNFEYDRIMRELELKSIIDHRNASDRAYDGETTTVLLQDEVGKITKKVGNVKRRVNVNRHCVQRGGDKRGILFGFTTVGNMEREGGMEFKEVFNDADQNNRNELGYTKNGFVNYFVSALEATVFDEWGNPVIDIPKDKRTIDFITKEQGPQYAKGSRFFHDTQKATLFADGKAKGDLSDYFDYCQNNPYTLKDAFSFSGKECIFNQTILQEAQHVINSMEPKKVRLSGYFEWVVKDKEVKFVEDPMNARCHVTMFPDGKVWIPNRVNSWTDHNGKTFYYPVNERFASSGFDPFSHKDVVDKNKASKAAFTLRTRFNYHFPEDLCETPIVHYKFRRDDPEDSFEDIIKICFFYSIPVLIESVQGGQAANSYFDKRGYGKFIMNRPKSTFTRKDSAQDKPMIPMSQGLIEQMCNLAASDINKNGRKFRQIEIVEDALAFNPNSTQKFDSFMSYGLSLIAAEKEPAQETKSFELGGLIPTYNTQQK